MYIGVITINLYIKNSISLKDKRKIIKSLIDRIEHKYNVSIAEVGKNNNHKHAVIGVGIIANDKQFIEKIINKIKDFISINPDVFISESEFEIW